MLEVRSYQAFHHSSSLMHRAEAAYSLKGAPIKSSTLPNEVLKIVLKNLGRGERLVQLERSLFAEGLQRAAITCRKAR